MKHVKDHFEEEAEVFDGLIRTLIPYYDDMVNSLVLALPFNEKEVKNQPHKDEIHPVAYYWQEGVTYSPA